jgi:hypothetical protein
MTTAATAAAEATIVMAYPRPATQQYCSYYTKSIVDKRKETYVSQLRPGKSRPVMQGNSEI